MQEPEAVVAATSKISVVQKYYRPVGAVVGALVLLLGGFVAGRQTSYLPIPYLTPKSPVGYTSLDTIDDLLRTKFDGDLDNTKLLDGAKTGLVAAAGDPYTVYLDAKAAKELSDELSGSLSGIGAEIAIKDNKLTVVAPISDSPAEKAGILAGDVIALIDDKNPSDLTLDQAVAKIRGDAGTTVKLKIVRTGVAEPFDVTITRALITVPSVKSSMKNGNVGYIQLTQK